MSGRDLTFTAATADSAVLEVVSRANGNFDVWVSGVQRWTLCRYCVLSIHNNSCENSKKNEGTDRKSVV